jgi:WD40 repeat protein
MMGADPYLPVWVWDAKTGKRRHILRGHTEPVPWLAFSPDERQLATGSLDGTLTIWGVATGKEVGTYRGHERDVRAVAYTPDGKRVIAVGSDHVVRTWDATRGPEYAALGCSGAWQAAFSPDGHRIAAAACRQVGGLWGIGVWDAETRQRLLGLEATFYTSRAVAFNPNGSQVAVAFSIGIGEGTVKVFDVATRKPLRSLPDQEPVARAVAHSTAQIIAARATAPASGFLGTLTQSLAALSVMKLDAFTVRAAPCDAVAWSPDGKLIASGGQDRIVRIWDAVSGQQLRELGGHTRTVSSVIFSLDGKHLVSASGGITRSTPDLLPGELLHPLKLPTDRPEDVPDVKVWDVTTGEELRSFRLPGKGPGLALSPDGKTIAVSFGDTGVSILRTAPIGRPAQVMFTILAAANGDVVRLYDVATGKEVGVLKGHTRPPWCVAFSPDGTRIVTGGGADQTLKLWDASTGQEIITIGRHPDDVTSVAFSPDGQKILSTSDDGDIRIWDASPVKK